MNKIQQRYVVATLLILLFVVVSVSGIILYILPSGPGDFFGIDKDFITNMHTYAGFVMVVLIAYHLYLNWPMYKNEEKAMDKE
ncbi:MAG: DUF4405 domain-containing protein [Candidatus Micrarchaeota archaeon]|nr:DUF4405 domain-containing protein [Candidatus Micrarchaeota archaeon]